jgi:hypothetical protein
MIARCVAVTSASAVSFDDLPGKKGLPGVRRRGDSSRDSSPRWFLSPTKVGGSPLGFRDLFMTKVDRAYVSALELGGVIRHSSRYGHLERGLEVRIARLFQERAQSRKVRP